MSDHSPFPATESVWGCRDVVSVILTFLGDAKAVCRARAVSRTCREAAAFAKVDTIELHAPLSSAAAVRAVTQCCALWPGASEFVVLNSRVAVTPAAEAFALRARAVRAVSFRGCESVGGALTALAARHAGTITSLDLTRVASARVGLDSFPALERLVVDGCPSATEAPLRRALLAAPRLAHVSFSSAGAHFALNDAFVFALAALPLRVLCAGWCNALSSKRVQCLLDALPHLEVLDLCGANSAQMGAARFTVSCTAPSLHSLQRLGLSRSAVARLSLPPCPALTEFIAAYTALPESDLLALIAAAPCLEHLDVRGVGSVSALTIAALATHSLRLRVLLVDSCRALPLSVRADPLAAVKEARQAGSKAGGEAGGEAGGGAGSGVGGGVGGGADSGVGGVSGAVLTRPPAQAASHGAWGGAGWVRTFGSDDTPSRPM